MLKIIYSIKYVAVFLFFIVDVCAQQYPITHYTRDKDLPGNQVWDIFQDSKGYMWFATSVGLIKYNGKEYERFGKKDGYLNDWPLGLSEDKDSALWVSSDKGVSRLSKDGTIETWVLSNSEDRPDVFVDSYGGVWIYNTLFPGDVFYYMDDSLHNFSSEYEFKNQTILNLTEDNEGSIFILTRSGKLLRFFTNKISEIDITLHEAGVRQAFFDSNNDLIICAEKGIGIIPNEKLYSDPQVKWIFDVSTNYGFQSEKGFYWFATNDNGIYRFENINAVDSRKGVINLTEKNGLLRNSITFMYEDNEGNIWLSYDLKGVSKISTLMFRKYTESEGLDGNAVFCVTKINGELYCSTENGLYKYRNGYFEKVNKSNEFANRWFLHVLPINENEILLGSVPGVYKYTRNSSIEFLGLKDKIAQTMMKDHTGKVWVGAHEGLYTLENNSFIQHDSELKDRAVFSLVEINDRDLYVGTDKGLFILKNSTIQLGKKEVITPDRIFEGDTLSDFISDLIVDADSSLIIASVSGLKVLANEGELYTAEGLADTEIITLKIDRKGNLWAGTTVGLFLLQKHKGRYVVTSRYSKREGLASDEFSFNNTIYEDSSGEIYFGMFGGLSIYNPAEDYSVSTKPRTYISGVQVNDSTFVGQPGELELSYRQNKISFYCEGLSFFNEDAVEFEYYLSPIEKEWSNISSRPVITYGYLEPNEYQFHIRSVNQFGVISEPKSVAFTISPPFWKQPWFLITSIVLLVIIGYQVNNYRQVRIRKRNQLLKQLVQKKTEDIEKNKQQIEKQFQQLVEAQKELVEKRELEKAHNEIKLLKERLSKENIYLREKQGIIQEVNSIIGRSKAIQEVRKKVVEVAGTNSTVLISGGTGVGKNLVAEAIHDLSDRKERTLITVNCAAIPDSLVESELFGHEKGAFTGAIEKREGKFEIANGSTIFLDEIGDMPLSVQAKLLNVLQSKKFMRVGGNKQIEVDLRIIAATNHNLIDLVEQGKFRQDLFYRINVYSVYIPPLKDRHDDIEPLAKYFIGKYARTINKNINNITKSALNILLNYSYPGNIRELENIIHRAVIICKSNAITDEDILISAADKTGENNGAGSANSLISLKEMERRHILNVLKKTNWKIRGNGGAAEILEINPGTLRSRMKKLDIPFVNDLKS